MFFLQSSAPRLPQRFSEFNRTMDLSDPDALPDSSRSIRGPIRTLSWIRLQYSCIALRRHVLAQ